MRRAVTKIDVYNWLISAVFGVSLSNSGGRELLLDKTGGLLRVCLAKEAGGSWKGDDRDHDHDHLWQFYRETQRSH